MALCLAAVLCSAPVAHTAAGAETQVSQEQVEKWLTPGRDAAAKGDHRAAIKLTQSSLSRASKQIPETHWARAYLLNDLARWQAAAGDRNAALPSAQKALQIAQAAFPDDPPRIAYFALDVGVLQFQLGDCKDARALLAQTQAGLKASPLRDQVATSAARVVWSMGELDNARMIAAAVPAPLLVALIDVDGGRLAAARKQLDSYRSSQKLSTEPGSWPSDYLEAELAYSLRGGDLRTALTLSQRSLELASSGSDKDAIAAAQHRLGQVLALTGRFAEADRLLNSAASHLDGDGTRFSPAAASVHHDLAWAYRSIGDYPRSEFHFEKALAQSGACAGPEDSMPVLMRRERALLRIDQGKVTQALADVDEASRLLTQVSGDTRVLQGLLSATRSFALERTGDLQGAATAMQAALQLITQSEGADSLNLPLGQIQLADLALRGKNFAVAQREAGAALRILDAHGNQTIWGTGAALSIRGAASAAVRAPAGFWNDTQRFVTITEQSLGPAGTPTSANQSEIALARQEAERLLDALPRTNVQLNVVARLMQLPHMSDATASLQTAALSSQNLPPQVHALVRRRAELLEESQALRTSLLLAQQRGQKLEPSAVVALTAATEQLAKADEELLRASPSVAGQLVQRAIDSADVQRHLADDESVLLQVLSEQTVHALLIDRNSVIYRSAAVERKQIRTDVRQLRRALDLSLPASDRVPFDATRANALYRHTVGLFAKELTGRKRLLVVADDALQSIPWSVLVDELDGAGGARSFLVSRFSIATIPSLQSLVALRSAKAHEPARKPYVAFADPKMERFAAADPNSLRGRNENAAMEVLRELPSLPESVGEVQRMAKLLGAAPRELYLGDRATEKALRGLDLGQFRIVSFATHGLMAGEVPGLSEPALVLTRSARSTDDADDGLLTASEIAHLSLDADLVILSACNTGRINAKTGVTGISALARAFFAAGARGLLVSHWAVASESTALLLAKTVERLAAQHDLGPDEALREAMLWMKDSGAGPTFSRPEFWGAFSAIGASV